MSAVDVVARGMAAKALEGGLFSATQAGAVTRTTTAKVVSDVPLSLLDFYDPVDPDMTKAVTNLGNAVAERGGNCRVIFPPAGAAYDTTQGLLITDPNVTIEIYNRLNYTGTTPQSLISFKGTGDDTAAGLLAGAKIINHSILDHNGLDIPWTYVTGNFFSTVTFEDCDAPVFRGGELWEGLMDCLSFFRCRRPLAERVRVAGSVNDNEISLAWNPGGFDPADPDTWCNGVLDHCQSANNRDFGQTVYVATGCTLIQPESWNNGIDGASNEVLISDGAGQFVIGTPGANGGGISFEGASTAVRLRGSVVGGRIFNNVSAGISQLADDVRYIGVEVEGVTTSSSAIFQGHALSIQALGGLTRFAVDGGRFSGAAKNGISARNSSNRFPSGEVDGAKIEGNGWEGLYAQGVERMIIGRSVRFTGNCTDAATAKTNEVYITNTGANGGAGVARVSAWFEQPNQRCVYISNVGAAYIAGAGAYKACKSSATIPFRIDCTDADYTVAIAEISNITIGASIHAPVNIGQITVLGTGVVTRSIVGANNGDHTSATAVTTTAVTKTGIASAQSDPAAITYEAPLGGATVDAEARASLAQAATDTAVIRTALMSMLGNYRNAGIQSR